MIPIEKTIYFEYLLFKLLSWHKEVVGEGVSNDISTLKSLKLLFFVSAAKASRETETSLVDTVFNKFVAMPYGPVESDIYSVINSSGGCLSYYTINNSSIELKSVSEITFDNLELDYKNKIDESIETVRSSNNDLIKLSAFDLVELSHLWYSWRKNYQMAIEMGQRSRIIPIEDIKSEIKIYKF